MMGRGSHTRRVSFASQRMRRARVIGLVGAGIALALSSCSGSASSSSATNGATRTTATPSSTQRATAVPAPSSGLGVPATRQPFTSDSRSVVAHDTETMALAAQGGRLFAATDQWMYSGPGAAGQILVKSAKGAAWTLFERTQSYRVQALDSFAIPADQGLGSGHSLLVTQAIVNGRNEIQWLLDGATSFSPADAFALPATADVRSFGAHESGGVWAVYAGVAPSGILRGTWSPAAHTLVFDPKPELIAAPPGSPGLKTQKVTGFAECGGAEYVSINTRLFRRNDGTLPPGVTRWVLEYQEPPVGAFNSGLRGLSCVEHDGAPSLLVSTEGSGNVYRLDHLPSGQVDTPTRLVPVLELSPIAAIRQMLRPEGTAVPASGKGSINYVISAYNNFESVSVGGVERQLFGFEWGYAGGCPPSRKCGPTAFGGVTYDAAACFMIRTDHGSSQTYAPRCLSGHDFTLTARAGKPIRYAQAFVSIRTIKASPFGDGGVYFGGYDCDFYPADGTAWVAASALSDLHPDAAPTAVNV